MICDACKQERATLKAELLERLETLRADFENGIDAEYWEPSGKLSDDNDGRAIYVEGRGNAKDEALQFIDAVIREAKGA